jgi:hypothetical protein
VRRPAAVHHAGDRDRGRRGAAFGAIVWGGPFMAAAGVDLRNWLLEVRIDIRTNRDAIELAGGKFGVGAAPPVIDVLRRRIGT